MVKKKRIPIFWIHEHCRGLSLNISLDVFYATLHHLEPPLKSWQRDRPQCFMSFCSRIPERQRNIDSSSSVCSFLQLWLTKAQLFVWQSAVRNSKHLNSKTWNSRFWQELENAVLIKCPWSALSSFLIVLISGPSLWIMIHLFSSLFITDGPSVSYAKEGNRRSIKPPFCSIWRIGKALIMATMQILCN